MTASTLGERGIIELIWSIIGKQRLNRHNADPHLNLVLPPPDDASAVRLKDGSFLVLKTDMFVRRTDAPRGMKHRQMGVKALAMNISDLAAKGAAPRAFLFSLGVPKSYRADKLEELIAGLDSASVDYSVPILGGDVGESRDLIVAGFAVGCAKKLVKRSGAEPGDIVAVTGEFGDTAAAFKILLERMAAPAALKRAVCNSVYSPKARLAVGLAVADSSAATSSMDSSDGLAFTLNGLAQSSNVGFIIESLPISAHAAKFAGIHGLDPCDLALFGGEEYEIVYTIKKALWDEAQRAVKVVNGSLIKIGEVVPGDKVILKKGKQEIPISARGWEHLKQNK